MDQSVRLIKEREKRYAHSRRLYYVLMAASGFFTYHDLYGGKAEIYHHESLVPLSSSTTVQTLSIPNTTTSSPPTTLNLFKLVSSTEIRSSTTNTSKLYKLVQLIPFAYFHWFLIGIAVLLAILLITVFTCYCRNYCRKTKKFRK